MRVGWHLDDRGDKQNGRDLRVTPRRFSRCYPCGGRGGRTDLDLGDHLDPVHAWRLERLRAVGDREEVDRDQGRDSRLPAPHIASRPSTSPLAR